MGTEELVPALGTHPLAPRPLMHTLPAGSVESILMASESKLCLLTVLVCLFVYLLICVIYILRVKVPL